VSAAFEIAPAGERTLDAAAYLAGTVGLAVVVAGFGFAAWRVRAHLMPGWGGAPARLVEAVLALAALLLASEALGTFAAFGIVELAAVAVVVGVAAWLWSVRSGARAVPAPPPAPPASRLAIWLAAGAVAAVAAAWMVPTLQALAGGMDRADTLWYHMPLATRFANGAHFGAIDYFDPIFFASYYPANSEVFHAVGIAAYDRDVLSPLLNLAWLGLGLTGAYCIGRPYGVGPQALIGGAIALGAQNLVEFQAGEALNDIVGVSLVLAAVGILVNGRRAGPLAVAGLAAGMAAGTKLSFLAPVVALFVAVVWIAARGDRIRSALLFGVPAFLAGGYWFVRNLVAVGNPIPFTTWGPLGLPSPERTFELRPGYSVFHYATDFDVWRDWFFPGLDESFGFLWPLVVAAFVGCGVYAVWRGRDPLLRALGAIVLFTAIAYVFTPLTAAGEEGAPIAFVWNVRYIAPAAAIGLALLPCLPAARATPRARGVTLGALAILFIATCASLVQWQQGHAKGAIAAGVGVVVAFAVLRWLRERGRLGVGAPRRWAIGLAALVAAGVLAAGWWEQRHFLEHRYDNLSPQLKIADAARWARDLRDAKVAISGVRGVFNQYPFYGTALENEVQWLGEEGPDGAYERIPTCSAWREALADGGYTHVVTMYDPFNPGSLTDSKEALWTREDAGAKEVMRDGPVSVFELTAPPDPSTCGDLPPLSAAELDGDSVNANPTANQPPGRFERGAAS
jgi:hypothetical protein